MNDINRHLGQLDEKAQRAEFRQPSSLFYDYIAFATAVIFILFAGQSWYFQ